MGRYLARALGAALLAAAVAPAAAAAAFPGTGVQRLSDEPSRNPAISQDRRFGRLAAFEADTGGTTNVYIVRRAEPYGEGGTPWQPGSTVLASRGRGGQPANGPSTRPSLDGTSRVAPHCVAFVSDASDLALHKTRNLSWRTAVTRVNPPGRRQVYIRSLGGTTGLDRALKGLTFLASATDRGVPGDGDSHSVAFSTNSRAIVWASDARNLSSSDGNGVSDVYQRVMTRRYGPKRHHHRAQQLAMDTGLVSAASSGNAGAGPSDSPAINVDGSMIAFTTIADDLVGRAARGIAQVVAADLGGGAPRLRLASRTSDGVPGNGPSGAPSLTAGGTWVVFDSAVSDVGVTTSRGPDANGVRDAIISTEPSGDRWLLGEGTAEATTNPMTSPHGNYIVFERGGHAQLLYAGAK